MLRLASKVSTSNNFNFLGVTFASEHVNWCCNRVWPVMWQGRDPFGPGLVLGKPPAKPLPHPIYGQRLLIRAERSAVVSTVLPGITTSGSLKSKFRRPLGNLPTIHLHYHHQARYCWGQGWRACRWTPGQNAGSCARCQTKQKGEESRPSSQ